MVNVVHAGKPGFAVPADLKVKIKESENIGRMIEPYKVSKEKM